MQLKESQIIQANALIEKYKFCSLETQKKLQEAGFFEKVKCNMCITVHRYNKEIPCDVETIESALPYGETIGFLPFPQFEDVWEVLPSRILIGSYENLKCVLENQVYYAEMGDGRVDAFGVDFQFEKESRVESACLLWLKLKEQNLL